MVIELSESDISNPNVFPVTKVLNKRYKNVVIGYYKTKLDDKTILTQVPVIECLHKYDNELELKPFSFEIPDSVWNA